MMPPTSLITPPFVGSAKRCLNHVIAELFKQGKIAKPTALALAQLIGVEPSNISQYRHKRKQIGPSMLVQFHQYSDIPIAELKRLSGLPPAKKFEVPDEQA